MRRQEPRILKLRSSRDPAAVAEAVRVLKSGCLVVIPTDTVYGLAADPRVPGAEERLVRAKIRPRDKPVPLLVADRAEAEAIGARFSDMEGRLAERFWPGPLTMVLRLPGKHERREGFRVPDHAFALALLSAAGGVLRVTSANRSGEPPAVTAADAVRAISDRVTLVLDAGRLPGGVPSTVVKVDNGTIDVLREGAITRAALEAACTGSGNGTRAT